MASVDTLRTAEERSRHTIMLVIGVLSWLAIAVSIVGLVYAALFAFIVWVVHAIAVAAVQGDGVRVGPRQLPDIYACVTRACEKLGVAEVPACYVLNDRTMLNAFAIRFARRHFVVLYAQLIEQAEPHPGALDFVVAHEIGHIALGHLGAMRWLMAPAYMVPLLGAAYRRACEYSCDQCGLAVAGEQQGAVNGLMLLAAGGRLAPRVDLRQLIAQRREQSEFWPAVVELGRGHPFLPKRVGAIVAKANPALVPPVSRNVFAYVFAPFLGGAGAGGAGGALMAVAIIGIMAAIAVPNFMKYKERAKARASQGQIAPQFSPPNEPSSPSRPMRVYGN